MVFRCRTHEAGIDEACKVAVGVRNSEERIDEAWRADDPFDEGTTAAGHCRGDTRIEHNDERKRRYTQRHREYVQKSAFGRGEYAEQFFEQADAGDAADPKEMIPERRCLMRLLFE